MKKLSLVAMFALALTITSCTGKQTSNNAQDADTVTVVAEEEVVAPAANYYGTYEGTLPCADCSGIKTVLTLNDDTTYDLTQEYLEKEPAFNESGTYTVENDLVTLITPSSGNKTYYKILDGKLALTPDSTGTMVEGEMAEHYILTKK